MTYHDTILKKLLEYRETHPNFNFIARQRTGKAKRFENGYWFPGNEKYAFVGLVNANGGSKKTKSVGVAISPTSNGFSCVLEIAFSEEKDKLLIEAYHALVKNISGINHSGHTNYDFQIGELTVDDFSNLFSFLDEYYTIIIEEFKIRGKDSVLISNEKFGDILDTINRFREKTEINYWLYAPGENAEKWDEFYEEGIMALGWDQLGDLKNYSSKPQIVERLQELANSTGSKKNDATANDEFANQMDIGDVVFVKKGKGALLGYGIVASDYMFDSERNQFKHVRRMDWKKEGEWDAGHNLVLKTLTNVSDYPTPDAKYPTYHERLMAIINGEEVSNTKNYAMTYPINTILYGPPGTGKTFNTVNLALEICGEEIEGLDRKEIKDLYDQKVSEGQIIFSTFHQSMSYEDFIEGIKPIEPEKEGDPVVYKVVEGIFKKACIEASFNFAMENDTSATDDILDFSLAYDKFLQILAERLATEGEIELEIKNGGKVYVDSISAQGNIQIKHLHGQRTYTVSKSRLSKLHNEINDLDEISNINDSFREIIGGSNSTAYWSVLNAIQKENHLTENLNHTERKYTPEDKIEVVKKLNKSIYKGNTGKPIVLIIDEINRGNVSAIFGELITLIEKDKRLGADEALLAQLPYSKEFFGVPPNLYIIGTMNTADRSVEALDSALRRRFSFTEMLPKPKFIKQYGVTADGTIDTIDLVRLLKTINKRIEKLLDKDHAIGHSYFLKTKSLNGLKLVFANKIIPLLQEYFFGDYGKIGLVLGSGFVELVKSDNDEKFFAPFDDYDLGSLVERKVYRINDATMMSNVQFKEALLQLLG